MQGLAETSRYELGNGADRHRLGASFLSLDRRGSLSGLCERYVATVRHMRWTLFRYALARAELPWRAEPSARVLFAAERSVMLLLSFSMGKLVFP